LTKGKDKGWLLSGLEKKYRSGVGKLLHMMRWTRPDILNAVRELSRFMSKAKPEHLGAMYRVMRFVRKTCNKGLTLKPERTWNGSRDFEFIVSGESDSDFAKNPDDRRSINGWTTFLEGAPVSARSKTMPKVALSVTEAELFAATLCAQDMLFAMRILNSIGLNVRRLMILYVDNKGAKDLADNWSAGGRTRHIETKQYFLRELKEDGILRVQWKKGTDNCADLFMKNLAGPAFEKHSSKFVS
jgi:hypothetical protein